MGKHLSNHISRSGAIHISNHAAREGKHARSPSNEVYLRVTVHFLCVIDALLVSWSVLFLRRSCFPCRAILDVFASLDFEWLSASLTVFQSESTTDN